MALVATQVVVDDDPTLLVAASVAGRSVVVHNAGSGAVFLGPGDVATNTGFGLGDGDTVHLALGPDDALYGIVASGTETVHVLSA